LGSGIRSQGCLHSILGRGRGQQDAALYSWHDNNDMQRWAELPSRRTTYPIYELMDHPTGTAVYRDPLACLKQTVRICNDYPQIAWNIKRIWIHGFYATATDRLVFDLLANCTNLRSLSVPWTMVRHLGPEEWGVILTSRGRPLESLELQCVTPTLQQRPHRDNHIGPGPLHSVDFSELRRLKIFGDTDTMPFSNADLHAITRTATRLEEFHLTNNSSITIDSVVAVVKASRTTLRVLEHNPRLQNNFVNASRTSRENDHFCEVLSDCPKLETLSISLPSVCDRLFSDDSVKFKGDLQVRAQHLCGAARGQSTRKATDLVSLLRQARELMRHSASSIMPRELYVEISLFDRIFEPGFRHVHGDFTLARVSSGGLWPQSLRQSCKGPYGSTGADQKEEHPFQLIDEEEFLRGCSRHTVFV
jgi:hypothetical protein